MEPTKEAIRALIQERMRGNFNGLVGLEFLEGGRGFARLRLPVRPEILQPAGIVHGGAVATLVDVTGGIGAHLSHPPGSRCVTVEMKINFIAAVSEGALLSEGAALHVGRRTSVWQVRVADERAGRIISFATATYMVVQEGPGG